MENLPLVEFEEIKKWMVGQESFKNDFSLADLDGSSDLYKNEKNEYSVPIRMDALLLVLTLEGRLQLSVDYIPYEVGPYTLITIMPTHTLQVAEISRDFKGRMLMVSRSFLDECNPPSRKGSSMIYYMRIRKNPCNPITREEAYHLNDCFDLLREKVRLTEHLFQKEVLQVSLIGFFLELANIFARQTDRLTPMTLSRKEELFEQFLQLLFKYCREQHVVTFYAEKLFITPQYLSLILKELTGKSANKWIDDALIVEAKTLLKAPQATVQQVADTLHFSDQSTFGKFFKKHMGVSPMEYRKS